MRKTIHLHKNLKCRSNVSFFNLKRNILIANNINVWRFGCTSFSAKTSLIFSKSNFNFTSSKYFSYWPENTTKHIRWNPLILFLFSLSLLPNNDLKLIFSNYSVKISKEVYSKKLSIILLHIFKILKFTLKKESQLKISKNSFLYSLKKVLLDFPNINKSYEEFS